MKFFWTLFLSLHICLYVNSTAQISEQKMGGSISGKVTDEQSGHAVEYANLILFSSSDSSQVNGTVSDAEGKFRISGVRPGKYYMDISFMGYEKKRVGSIQVSRSSSGAAVDLGEIKIRQKGVTLNNVVVEGDRVPFSYKIDKKVIDVEKMSTTISGTAADVLSNVPSVSVDIDGNVSLRGSGSFTVLIDGRPTILDAQEALQQVPASTIQDIEIITNPSAKYDPEGVAGIINVVLKKNKSLGISGLANLSGGLNDKYGADGLVEIKNEDITVQLGADYNKRSHTGDGRENRISTYQGNTSYINGDGDMRRGRDNYGLKGNINFNLSDRDVLGFGGRLGHREMNGSTSLNRVEYSLLQPVPVLSFNRNNEERSGDFFSLNMNFQHKFETKGHELTADASYEYDDGNETSSNLLLTGGAVTEGKKTTESGPSKEFDVRLDYSLPVGAEGKFEAGLQGNTDIADEFAGMYEFDTALGQYAFRDQFSYDTKSTQSAYSLYSTYSDNIKNFGFQAGVRGEYTFRDIELISRNQKFNIDDWDIFPSLHLSYKFSPALQLMGSYTKRIQRPRNWALEPFETWQDANTVRRGNPGLKPELIDSYELGFQTLIQKVSLSTELYYRVNNNKIEGVRSVYSDDVTLQTFENIGKDYSLGTEMMLSFDVFKFWNIDLMANAYDYRVEGEMSGASFSKNSFNWRGKWNNLFRLSETLQLQINAEYNSPTVSSQSKTKEFFTTDLAVKKDLFEKKLALTLQVRDLFKTGKFESTTETLNLYTFGSYTREAPVVMLSLRYSINNFKQRRERGDMQDGGGGYGEEGF